MITVKVVLFASLRESLGKSEVALQLAASTSVSGLINSLGRSEGDRWTTILSDGNVLTAVNQTMVEVDHPVADGDEVAFFPPVTGG